MLFELSEADLSYALELHDEKHLQSLIATLPDTTVRALLLQAATHHAPTAKRVLAAAPTEPLVGSAANATPPTRLPDSPPTPPERTRAARDSFDVLRSSLSLDGNRGAHQLTISGVVLDSNDYFATKAREAIRVLNGVRRRDALASLVREINVMIDLGHGLFAMRAIVAVLDVVTNRSAMDGELCISHGVLGVCMHVRVCVCASHTSPSHQPTTLCIPR